MGGSVGRFGSGGSYGGVEEVICEVDLSKVFFGKVGANWFSGYSVIDYVSIMFKVPLKLVFESIVEICAFAGII